MEGRKAPKMSFDWGSRIFCADLAYFRHVKENKY
jgi:hypothetical protein